MKSGIIKAFLGFAALVGAGSLIPSAASADSLRWGYNSAPFPPWTNKSPSGEWRGFDIDIMNSLCREMKATCEIVPVAWDGIIPALNANKIDIIWSGMSMTEEREKVVDFTDRYRRGPAAFVAAKADPIKITKEGLKDRIVAVTKATNFYNYLEHYYGGSAKIKLYDTLDDATADLVAGRNDVVMGDILQLTLFMKNVPGQPYEIKGITPVDPILGRGAGAGIRKGDTVLKDRINAAIASIRKTGEYTQIAKKYFEHDPYGE
jgi:polar amino acid transport system substrate-binding protein